MHCGISFYLNEPVEQPPKKEQPTQIIHKTHQPKTELKEPRSFINKMKIPIISILIILGIVFSAQSLGFISIYSPNIQDDNFIGHWLKHDVSWMELNETNSINCDLFDEINGSGVPDRELTFIDENTCTMHDKQYQYHIEPNHILVIGSNDHPKKYNYVFSGNQNETLILRYIQTNSLITFSYKKQ